MRRSYFIILVLLLLSFYSPRGIQASGLDLTLLYGSRYVGLGGQQVAVVDDAYASFYNPAGLMGVKTLSLVANSSTLLSTYDAPIGAANAQRESDLTIGPLFYLGGAYRLTDRVVIGMGVYPTALQGGKFSNVNYSANITGKELSTRLARIEIAPSVAVRVVGPLSLGMSYRLGYTRIENKGGFFGVTHLDTTMSAWDGKGFKIGAYMEKFHNFRAALTWRFRQTINLRGSATLLTDNGVAATPTPLSTSTKINIASRLQFGLAYDWIPEKLMTALSYEFTGNDVISNNTLINRADGSVVSTTPVGWKDGHALHLGTEYVFALKGGNKLRTNIGLAYDKAVTKSSVPNPVAPPSADYIGYAAGAQYEMERQAFGLALNYGEYSSNTATVDPATQLDVGGGNLVNSVFPGKYSLVSWFVVADYKFHF